MIKTSVKPYRRAVALVLTLALATAGVMVPTDAPEGANAAQKPKLSSGKGTILTGESETVTINNVKKKKIKKLTVSSSDKGVATAKKSGKTAFVVKTKKAGKATVQVKLILKNKKKYTLKYKATVADIVDREVPVRNYGREGYDLSLRFFAETPHIPYIHATMYYKLVSGDKELTVEKKKAGEYLLTVPDGATATVNTDTDVLTTDQFEEFKKIRTQEEGDAPKNSSYGGAPFLLPLDDQVIQPGKTITMRFSDYGLDLRGDTNDIWLPLQTADNLFLSDYGAAMYYTGNCVYQISDEYESDQIVSDGYLNDYLAQYPDGVRPADVVEYTYQELAFLIDTHWGNPGRCYFSDAIRNDGFNRALSETDDATRGVQKLLKSTNLSDYLLGRGILQDMLFDGGHTSLAYYDYDIYGMLVGEEKKNYVTAYRNDLREAAEKIGYTIRNTPNPDHADYISLMESKPWNDSEYREEGDTAVFTFDGFTVDIDGWNNYYQNGGEIPDDTYGSFIKYLNRAAKSNTIKNFVLDVTGNRGGDDNAYAAMMSVMTGDPTLYDMSSKSGQMSSCSFKVDKNLDGKFDEKDDAVHYPFRFAILETKLSFSCANLLACYGKDAGIVVLGERSGGGCCAVAGTSMGDGDFCRISMTKTLVTKDGNAIDGGAEPDVALEVKKNADGTNNYSSFFDISSLSKYINEYYAA